jgi:aspartyl protease family protein
MRSYLLLLSICALFSSQVGALELQVKMLAKGTAVINVDGKQRMLREGAISPEGVKLIAADGAQAVVEVEGKREVLKLNRKISTQFAQAEKVEVRIASAEGGHYFTHGKINGVSVQFMVDTGATGIAMNHIEAERIGIDYRAGTSISVNTANGIIQAYSVVLSRVSVGNIELNQVTAAVSTTDSPEVILLGNSYLGKLDMSIVSGVLVLKEK